MSIARRVCTRPFFIRWRKAVGSFIFVIPLFDGTKKGTREGSFCLRLVMGLTGEGNFLECDQVGPVSIAVVVFVAFLTGLTGEGGGGGIWIVSGLVGCDTRFRLRGMMAANFSRWCFKSCNVRPGVVA